LSYIITSHGSDVLGYNVRFKFLYPLLTKVWKNILNSAEKIISPSNFLKREISKAYSEFNSEKIVIIPNGFSMGKFIPQDKKKYIFSSGRFLRSKGFQYLIKAVSVEDIGYEIHIAGDGPMMGELRCLANTSKTKIIFHGWLDNKGEEYKNLLEQSAIFVLVSERESFGMSILEAMSAGCAVISTNISGCAEIVGDSGLLIKPNDVQDLLSKIKYIIDRADILAEFKEKSLIKVKEYDWGKIIGEYIKVL